MGSFNVKCAITGMNIQPYERCVAIAIQKNKFSSKDFINVYEIGELYRPISFPIRTTYYDYGRPDIKREQISIYNQFLEDSLKIKFSDDVDDNSNDDETEEVAFMMIHEKVFDSMSKTLFGDDFFFGQYKKVHEEGVDYIYNQMMAYIKKLDDAEGDDRFVKIMASLHHEGMVPTAIRYDHIIQELSDHLSRSNDRSLFTRELAEVLHEKIVFEFNLSILQKFYIPSGYASQTDRIECWRVINQAMDEILTYKERDMEEDYCEDEDD